MTGLITAAAVQLNSQHDKQRNLLRSLELIQRAAERGAQLVGLPEVCNFIGPPEQARDMAEEIPGPTIECFQQAARRHALYLLAGSILETNPDNPAKPFNTSCLIGPSGDLLGLYRKIHLFDVDLPGEFTYKESQERTCGDQPVVVDTPLGKIGLSICYDVRFPELYRRLSEQGAEILFVPAAFTMQTGRDHWHVLLRARAIENQAFVIAPAQTGSKGDGLVCYGRSLIINPWGTILAQAEEGESVILADLDFETLAGVRRKLPCLQHRKLR
ncbi:MAG: carbon-nitrogen hydrolase family protein [Armatimonadetes bacterium]|nr:carbon-nitrogen hydrolase family protein [Armatimonadota bacterium]